VAPDCPVLQEDKAPTVDRAPNPNDWVTWRRTRQGTMPVRWCTGLSSAPIASSLPNGYPSGWGLKIPPNHHNNCNPSFLKISFNTRALAFTPRHNTKDQILSESQIHSKHLVACEREIFVFICALVAWIAFLLFHSYSQVLCKRSKRHQVCGGPCRVLVTREIKEEDSLGLSDRLRERKG
jgi:hypothetical protein